MKEKKINRKIRKRTWNNDPRKGFLIDDSALFVLNSISRGHFFHGGKDNWYSFTARQPIEWNHRDMLNFLIQASDEYKIKLKNFSTLVFAFEDYYEKEITDKKGNILPEYEGEFREYVKKNKKYEECMEKHKFKGGGFLECSCYFSIPPRHYEGGYKWALNKIEEKPLSEEGELLNKFLKNNEDLTLEDLQKIFRMNSVILALNEPENSEKYYVKEITNSIIDYTTFDVPIGEKTSEKMKKDIQEYLNKFIKDGLDKTTVSHFARGSSFSRSRNILTFENQKEMFMNFLFEKSKKYGNSFSFNDPFDDFPLPNGDDRDEMRDALRERYENQEFLFMHTIFAFEKLGFLKIQILGSNWEFHERKPVKYFAKVELLPSIFKEFGLEKDKDNLERIKNDFIEIKGDKNKFILNLKNGDFVLNEIKGTFPLVSQEYKVIKKLIKSESFQSDYEELVKSVWSNRNNSKASRNDLSLVIKKIKTKLNILPKKKSNNDDIFKNIKNFGYRIVVK